MSLPKIEPEFTEADQAISPETLGSLAELEAEFTTLKRKELEDYALNTTQALVEAQEAIAKLTDRYDATQSWALGLAMVEEIGQNLAATLDLKEVLTQLLSRTYEAINVEDGSVLLVEEPSGDLLAQVVLGALSEGQEPFRVPKGQGIAGEVAANGVPIIVNNVARDPRHFNKVDKDTGFLTKSLLCVPILTRNRIIGVLEVLNKKSGPFTQHDQILLSSIANFAGIAIENAQLHQSVVEERNHVIRAQEEVSHKLVRDLHDGPTQLVAAIQMSIDFCQKALQHNRPEIVNDELKSMLELTQRASHQLRTLLFELRPLILETKGLVAALEKFIERHQAEEDKVQLHLVWKSDTSDEQISRLDVHKETALFAIVQEAVNNALKYAQANHIFVHLNQHQNQLTVLIADDGTGFDVATVLKNYEERGSYGMVNLRERVAVANGQYTINSMPGQGTKIQVKVPITP